MLNCYWTEAFAKEKQANISTQSVRNRLQTTQSICLQLLYLQMVQLVIQYNGVFIIFIAHYMLDNFVYKINYQIMMPFVHSYSSYNSVGPAFGCDNIQWQKYVNIQKIQI